MTAPSAQTPLPAPPADGSDLHPLTIGRVAQLTVGMLRFRARPVFGAALVPLIPAHAVAAFVQLPFVQRMNEWVREWQSPPQTGGVMFRLPAGWGEVLALVVLTGIGLALATLFATAAVTWVAAEVYAGRPVSIGRALNRALRRFGSVVGAHLLYLVGLLLVVMTGFALAAALFVGQVGGGLMAFVGLIVIVGTLAALLFLAVRWSLVLPALMVEGRGPMAALGRSWHLVAGSGWRVLGYLLAFGLVVGLVATLVVDLVLAIFSGTGVSVDPLRIAVQSFVAGAVTALLTPVSPVAMTLLFLDVRWRREATATTGVGSER